MNRVIFTISMALCCPVLLCGCIYLEYRAQPADIAAYAREKQNEGAAQNLLWYRGRAGDFDYFKYVHGMFAERRFKVAAGAIAVPKVFALTDDSDAWVQIKSIEKSWQFNYYDFISN